MPSDSVTRQRLLTWLKWAVTAILLGFVLHNANLFSESGIKRFIQEVSQANGAWLLLSFAVPVLMSWISALKWWYLSASIGLEAKPRTLFRYYLIGNFFNLVLPSNIGGDVIRIRLQGRRDNNYASSAAAVFMDRYTGLIVLLVLAAICLIYTVDIEIPMMREAMLITLIGLAFITKVLFHKRALERLRSVIEPRAAFSRRSFDVISRLQQELGLYTERPRVLVGGLVLGVVFYVFSILYTWVCLLAFDPSVPVGVVILGVPLIMIIMNLPISMGGVGLAEFGFAVVLGSMGVAAETALAGVLLLRLHTFFMGGIGWLAYVAKREPAATVVLSNLKAEANT